MKRKFTPKQRTRFWLKAPKWCVPSDGLLNGSQMKVLFVCAWLPEPEDEK
jgi:hypothetical protein